MKPTTDHLWRQVDRVLQTAIGTPRARECIVRHSGCEGLTAGSTGAAGICWPNICPNCKSLEDGALSASLTAQARAMDAIYAQYQQTRIAN